MGAFALPAIRRRRRRRPRGPEWIAIVAFAAFVTFAVFDVLQGHRADFAIDGVFAVLWWRDPVQFRVGPVPFRFGGAGRAIKAWVWGDRD